jgi:hypothetical protein
MQHQKHHEEEIQVAEIQQIIEEQVEVNQYLEVVMPNARTMSPIAE